MMMKFKGAFHGPLKKKLRFAKVGSVYPMIASLVMQESKLGFG